MATRTSAKSGLWSATDTWVGGVVPANADGFIIDGAHDVVFDVDQSTMAAGMAASTIRGILRFDTTKDTFLKMNAILSLASVSGSPAILFVGNSWADPIPRGITATIQFPATNTYINGNSNAAFFFGWVPQHDASTVAAAALTDATTLVLADDMELLPGEQIVIGATGAPLRTEPDWENWYNYNDHRMITGVKGKHTVQSYDPATKTVTLAEPLEHDRAAGDLVGRLTRQIVVKRPTLANYAVTSLTNARFEGVQFFNTRGPSSHQWKGFLEKYKSQFPGIEAGVYHCTAYNTGTGGLAGNPSATLIEDCVVYYDAWADAYGIQGIIHTRDAMPSRPGIVRRVICINTHGQLIYNARWCLVEDIVTQNTGGYSGFSELSDSTVRRWVSKSPIDGLWAMSVSNCVFEDCSPNSMFEGASRAKVLNRLVNVGGEGQDASLSECGMFFWQRDERPKILRGRTCAEPGWIWHDYPVFFPAGVPLTFAVRCRIKDARVQARVQIVPPEHDPVASPTFNRDINWQWTDWRLAGSNMEDAPAADSTSKIVGPLIGCLAEVELPDDIEVDEWAVLRITYTSSTDRTLWVRLWANDWQTFAEWKGIGQWAWPTPYVVPNAVRVEFDVSAVEVMLGQAAHVPARQTPKLLRPGQSGGEYNRRI